MLPKIQYPTFDVTIPSTETKIKIRPMLVKEEKILLMAKQSESRKDVIDAVKQIVNNCTVSENVNVEKFTLFDLEYMFIKIRAISISNIAKVSYRDSEDDKVYDFDVDLDKVELTKASSNINIDLGSNLSIQLRYPAISLYSDREFFDLPEDKMFDRILSSAIEKIFEGDKVYSFETSTKQEIQDFINSIPAKHYGKIREFFAGSPSLNYELKYTNSAGTERVIKLTTLDDFFTFV